MNAADYKWLRKCERKWRRYGRMSRAARSKANIDRATEFNQKMLTWLGKYNGAVMRWHESEGRNVDGSEM